MSFKTVSKAEFDAFIAAYPRKLVRDVAAMYEPPLLTFNDFTLAPKWPQSVVAKIILHADSYPNPDGSKKPNEYLTKHPDERSEG
jgi:hypothetical protein